MSETPNRLEATLDELYASDPNEFVARRKQLATELRAGGDKDGAKELMAARRPSTSAAALNQLARREPHRVEALLDRSRDLVAEQTRPGPSGRDALREAIRAHREALDDATDAALATLGTRANDAFRSEIVATLRAASTDAGVRRLLTLGRVVKESATAAGFPEAVGLTLVPPPLDSSPSEKPKAAKRDAARDLAARDREQAANAAREAARRADLALRDAARERAATARAQAASSQQAVERLEAELDTARRELRAAREQDRKAAAEVERLTARLGQSESKRGARRHEPK